MKGNHMMKRFTACFLFLALLAACAAAGAAAIKVKGLKETQLYDLYSQVQSQIQLNQFSGAPEYNASFNYEDIERNPGRHTEEKIRFEGKILQVVEGSYSTTYRITAGKTSSDVFLITYARPEGTERFLQDDIVCVYAVFEELKTYSSTVNKSVTAPLCEAALIIRPVTDTNVANASPGELETALTDIRESLTKAVSKDKGYSKLTKTNYEDYARHESLHEDEPITATGKVLQVVEGSERNTIRLAVDSNSDMVIYLTEDPQISSIRILEDDTITVTGKYTGLYTYSSTRGGEITIPSASVETVTVKGYKAPSKISKDKAGNYALTKKVFEDYSRRPGEHMNEPISFSAKVLQVIEGDSVSQYRMAVDSDNSCVIYVKIPNSARSTRVLEDDKVTVTATFEGLTTYKSTYGVSITIPVCTASGITVPGKTTSGAKQDSSGAFKVTKKNYENFARDEQTYLNKTVSFTARVVQVVDGDDGTIYRLAVDKSYDAIFLGTISNSDLSIRILEDDIVKIDGTSTGLYSYNSTRGGKITIPSCKITSYSVDGYKQKNLGSPDGSGYYKITKSNFEELARNPDAHKGKKITCRAKVIQVVERTGKNIYRAAVDSDSDCIFYVEYSLPSGASRILEKDIVTLKGEFYGIYTYSSTMGGAVSVPALMATEMKK